MPDPSPILGPKRAVGTLSYHRPTWRETLSSEWRRIALGFTRDNVISNLKTLAYVIPLTLLIWIYAEREQVATTKDVAVPFELQSVDPDRVVTTPQDRN